MHTHVEASVEVAYLPKLLSTSLLEKGPLTEPGVHSLGEAGWPAAAENCLHIPRFYMGPGT